MLVFVWYMCVGVMSCLCGRTPLIGGVLCLFGDFVRGCEYNEHVARDNQFLNAWALFIYE